ncbi:MAG TPA: thioredoxin domain-containing protein [Anaerolineales bacterium]|nr:thioredoxin domain-containing protein [Anaerolineales bacterium]
MPNRLANSTSPYLRQHADNPVDWYPWGPEALARARDENKPIFLSIGYSACHWCHVMAHESFENPETAALMNRLFVSIKVDREERPDLDAFYMSAVSSLTGQGGWPLSVFLTPGLQPFYGGTYFPPEPRHGLPAFRNLLQSMADAWRDQPDEVLRVGGQVVSHLTGQSQSTGQGKDFQQVVLMKAVENLIASYDPNEGGWGPAPKFPQPMAIEFLLRRHLAGDAQALKPALHTLRAMARGGMYDILGGGFARYSTDETWLVPHFEKMLYDNAQLARVYLHAWQLTGDDDFRAVVESTLAFVAREMTSPEGGFYSSLDADSGGQEGSFYAWTLNEIRSILGADADLFELAYGIRPTGNWEGRTILQRAVDNSTLAIHFNRTEDAVAAKLLDSRAKLLAARSSRVRPATDDKVLTAWNGLMLEAFAEAARAFDTPEYLQIASRNAGFLLTALRPDGKLRRAWRDGRPGREVFLDDYAALVLGLLALYQADFDVRWYLAAVDLAKEMLDRFSDPAGGFFDTPEDAEHLFVRPKELQDSAVPCGSSLAAESLLRLASLEATGGWETAAQATLGVVAGLAPRYPTAFGRWLCAADYSLGRVKQVVIVGEPGDRSTQELLAETRKGYFPNSVVAASSYPPAEGTPGLLADRPMVDGKATAYVCEGFFCRLPVTDPGELARLLTTSD